MIRNPVGFIGESILGATSGSILFADSNSALGQDNANLFWDDTNNRLGIGTSSPNATLDIGSTTEQLRLMYDSSNYLSTTVGSTGTVTFDAIGSGSKFVFSDPLRVPYLGLGVAAVTYYGINAQPTLTGSSLQIGCVYSPIIGSDATTGYGGYAAIVTPAASFTLTSGAGYIAADATLGAGSAITNLHGYSCGELTKGTNNFGYGSSVSSGSNKWNFYASGTAQNYFNGNVGIGTTTASAKLHSLATTEQLRLGYDISNYVSYTVSSVGDLTVATTGTNAGVTFTPTGTGNLKLSTGKASFISTGSSPVVGNSSLVAGTKAVLSDAVTANTVVMLTRKTSGGTVGTAITYTLQTSAPKGFTINSDNILDTSTFSWLLVESF